MTATPVEVGDPTLNAPARAQARRSPPPWYLWLPVAFCGAGVLLPLAYLIVRALSVDAERLGHIVLNWRNVELLINTLLLTAVVLIVTTLVAVPAAWLTTRTDLPFRRTLTVALVLPLAVPGYLLAYTLLAFTGDYGALAQFTRLIGFEQPWVVPRPVQLFGAAWGPFVGAVIALSLYNFPYMALNLRAAMSEMDPGLEEIARSLGHRPMRAFFTVILPQLRPAMLAGSLLVGLHVIMDFGVVSLMGYHTFSYALFLQYSAAYDVEGAAWVALMLLSLAFAFVALELLMLRGIRLHRAGGGVGRLQRPVRLGIWAWPAVVFILSLVTLGVLIPAGTIGFWATRADYALIGEDLWLSVRDSLTAAGPAAIIATLLAMPVAWMARRYPSKRSVFFERVAYLGYATPSLAFALGLLVVSLYVDSWFLAPQQTLLYQSLAVLIYAYSLHFLAEAVGPIRAGLFHATPRVEEASRSLGVGPVRTFLTVTLPLLRPGLIVALTLVFLSAMKELPLTILLKPNNFQTLSQNIWDKTHDASYADAAPFALLILVISMIFVGVLMRGEKSGDRMG
jgi:iron(III) transport system permease protein